jgi:hypothetical protein
MSVEPADPAQRTTRAASVLGRRAAEDELEGAPLRSRARVQEPAAAAAPQAGPAERSVSANFRLGGRGNEESLSPPRSRMGDPTGNWLEQERGALRKGQAWAEYRLPGKRFFAIDGEGLGASNLAKGSSEWIRGLLTPASPDRLSDLESMIRLGLVSCVENLMHRLGAERIVVNGSEESRRLQLLCIEWNQLDVLGVLISHLDPDPAVLEIACQPRTTVAYLRFLTVLQERQIPLPASARQGVALCAAGAALLLVPIKHKDVRLLESLRKTLLWLWPQISVEVVAHKAQCWAGLVGWLAACRPQNAKDPVAAILRDMLSGPGELEQLPWRTLKDRPSTNLWVAHLIGHVSHAFRQIRLPLEVLELIIERLDVSEDSEAPKPVLEKMRARLKEALDQLQMANPEHWRIVVRLFNQVLGRSHLRNLPIQWLPSIIGRLSEQHILDLANQLEKPAAGFPINLKDALSRWFEKQGGADWRKSWAQFLERSRPLAEAGPSEVAMPPWMLSGDQWCKQTTAAAAQLVWVNDHFAQWVPSQEYDFETDPQGEVFITSPQGKVSLNAPTCRLLRRVASLVDPRPSDGHPRPRVDSVLMGWFRSAGLVPTAAISADALQEAVAILAPSLDWENPMVRSIWTDWFTHRGYSCGAEARLHGSASAIRTEKVTNEELDLRAQVALTVIWHAGGFLSLAEAETLQFLDRIRLGLENLHGAAAAAAPATESELRQALGLLLRAPCSPVVQQKIFNLLAESGPMRAAILEALAHHGVVIPAIDPRPWTFLVPRGEFLRDQLEASWDRTATQPFSAARSVIQALHVVSQHPHLQGPVLDWINRCMGAALHTVQAAIDQSTGQPADWTTLPLLYLVQHCPQQVDLLLAALLDRRSKDSGFRMACVMTDGFAQQERVPLSRLQALMQHCARRGLVETARTLWEWSAHEMNVDALAAFSKGLIDGLAALSDSQAETALRTLLEQFFSWPHKIMAIADLRPDWAVAMLVSVLKISGKQGSGRWLRCLVDSIDYRAYRYQTLPSVLGAAAAELVKEEGLAQAYHDLDARLLVLRRAVIMEQGPRQKAVPSSLRLAKELMELERSPNAHEQAVAQLHLIEVAEDPEQAFDLLFGAVASGNAEVFDWAWNRIGGQATRINWSRQSHFDSMPSRAGLLALSHFKRPHGEMVRWFGFVRERIPAFFAPSAQAMKLLERDWQAFGIEVTLALSELGCYCWPELSVSQIIDQLGRATYSALDHTRYLKMTCELLGPRRLSSLDLALVVVSLLKSQRTEAALFFLERQVHDLQETDQLRILPHLIFNQVWSAFDRIPALLGWPLPETIYGLRLRHPLMVRWMLVKRGLRIEDAVTFWRSAAVQPRNPSEDPKLHWAGSVVDLLMFGFSAQTVRRLLDSELSNQPQGLIHAVFRAAQLCWEEQQKRVRWTPAALMAPPEPARLEPLDEALIDGQLQQFGALLEQDWERRDGGAAASASAPPSTRQRQLWKMLLECAGRQQGQSLLERYWREIGSAADGLKSEIRALLGRRVAWLLERRDQLIELDRWSSEVESLLDCARCPTGTQGVLQQLVAKQSGQGSDLREALLIRLSQARWEMISGVHFGPQERSSQALNPNGDVHQKNHLAALFQDCWGLAQGWHSHDRLSKHIMVEGHPLPLPDELLKGQMAEIKERLQRQFSAGFQPLYLLDYLAETCRERSLDGEGYRFEMEIADLLETADARRVQTIACPPVPAGFSAIAPTDRASWTRLNLQLSALNRLPNEARQSMGITDMQDLADLLGRAHLGLRGRTPKQRLEVAQQMAEEVTQHPRWRSAVAAALQQAFALGVMENDGPILQLMQSCVASARGYIMTHKTQRALAWRQTSRLVQSISKWCAALSSEGSNFAPRPDQIWREAHQELARLKAQEERSMRLRQHFFSEEAGVQAVDRAAMVTILMALGIVEPGSTEPVPAADLARYLS